MKERNNPLCIKPKLFIKDTKKYGVGVFAGESIKKGQLIKVLSGEIISLEECIKRVKMGEETMDDPLQIGLRLYIDLDYPSRAFNHSCNPNAGLRNDSELFALRDIRGGEEIAYNYSTTVGPNITSSIWTMKCKCGSKDCRKLLGNILTIPEKTLQQYKKSGALQEWIQWELEEIERGGDGGLRMAKYEGITLYIRNEFKNDQL